MGMIIDLLTQRIYYFLYYFFLSESPHFERFSLSFLAYVRFLLYKQPWGPRAIKLAEVPIYRYGSNSPNWKYRIPLVQLMSSLYMLIVLIYLL